MHHGKSTYMNKGACETPFLSPGNINVGSVSTASAESDLLVQSSAPKLSVPVVMRSRQKNSALSIAPVYSPAAGTTPCNKLSCRIPTVTRVPKPSFLVETNKNIEKEMPSIEKKKRSDGVQPVPARPAAKRQRKLGARLLQLTQVQVDDGFIGSLTMWQELANFIKTGTGLGVLHGRVGSGKSFGLRILASKLNMDVVEIDSTMLVPDMRKVLRRAGSSGDLPKHMSLVVCEDINGWQKEQILALLEFANMRTIGVVLCTCDDIWDPSLKTLRGKWTLFKLGPASLTDARRVLHHASSGRSFTDEQISSLLKRTRYDLRQLLLNSSFLLDLHTCDRGAQSIFDATSVVLSGPLEEAQWSMRSQPQFLMEGMLFGNYIQPHLEPTLNELVATSDAFSWSDCMRERGSA
eukprot:6214396-Pleurochrysis_carterae.AAC.3